MNLSDFDYDLPPELIAQAPLERRDASRLLHLRRAEGAPRHLAFSQLPELLRSGDLLILNDTRVIPARLLGHRSATGGKVELLLNLRLEPDSGGERWRCLGRASKRLKEGASLCFGDLRARVEVAHADGSCDVLFETNDLEGALARNGTIPLPPYIQRPAGAEDGERYQTIFAKRPGAVAAPTAGLHLTEELLSRLSARGVERAFVTLHVGAGTFLPVRTESIEEHRMHAERFEVGAETAAKIRETQERGGRIVACGTTALRALESAGAALALGGAGGASQGLSELFIYPGYRFQVVDALITNFHLPRSTLLMLVSAFVGRERILSAYREAIERGYRFFSYGDAMFLE